MSTPTMIPPTVGRVVLIFAAGASIPEPALICCVHNERLINVGGFDRDGNPIAYTSLKLLQEGDPKPDAGVWAEWMPYQKGQAAKTEALERALQERAS